MNLGGVRASLLYNQISGGEKPGEVTYAEAFTVQPFGNTLVVKTCTGQQFYTCSSSSSPGRQRVMPSLAAAYSWTRAVPVGTKRDPRGSHQDRTG